ncbi:MAG: ABC transporter substrate-binding protein [Alphaproteobacteria bacterium]
MIERPIRRRQFLAGTAALAAAVALRPRVGLATPVEPVEPEFFAKDVTDKKLPPIGERLPAKPLVVAMSGYKQIGVSGGEIRILMQRAQDTRLMVVYSGTRLVSYDEKYNLVPDLLEECRIEDGRIFTFVLRKGHKWSDGHPFTAEDFRYYWEDVLGNKELSPFGPPVALMVDGKVGRFELIDEGTVRYSWDKPNPFFLPAIAGPAPTYLYRPGHYLRQFHSKYADKKALAAIVKEKRQRSWARVHSLMDNMYRNNNPDLPTLEPWRNTTPSPADRFLFVRNPFYHRIDEKGQQLPYIDRVIMNTADGKIIPAKAGAGESDLQARYIKFSDYTFLKRNEKQNHYRVLLWRAGTGSHIALYPNMNANDPIWRALNRDLRYRRALSLAINRREINQVMFYGLAKPAANTVLPESPLYRKEYADAWIQFDLKRANALLDDIGLRERTGAGFRKLPNGKLMELVVETTTEGSEAPDVLNLIKDSWREIGIRLLIKSHSRDNLRRRVFSGDTKMAVWSGLDNGLPTADMSPSDIAPTSQQQFQWPKWGQFAETRGTAGEPIDMDLPRELFQLNGAWESTATTEERARLWHRMLGIYTDQVFAIGIVSSVSQPVLVSQRMRNVPTDAIYSFEPGGHLGIYRPDTFWLAGTNGTNDDKKG